MTAAAGDAHPFPIYGGRFRFTFPIRNATGFQTAAAGLDSEISKDQGSFVDCTNEATEIGSSGIYSLDLVASDTTCKSIRGITKTSTSGAFPTEWDFAVERMPVLESGTAQAGGASTITLASGASAKDGFYNGLYLQCSNNTPANVQGQTRKIISYVGSTRVATVEAAWGTNPSSSTTYDILIPATASVVAFASQRMSDWTTAGVPHVRVADMASSVLTATAIATDAITAAKVATDAVAEIADGVWDEALSGHATAGSAGAGLTAAGASGDPWSTSLPGSYGAGTAGNIIGNRINDTITSRASQTSVNTIDDFVDTEVAAIKAVTDQLPSGGALTDLPVNVTKWLGSTPNALQSGRPDVSVGNMQPNVLTASSLSADAVDEILDEAVEGGITLRQATRVMLAVAAGKAAGAGTNIITFRDANDTKVRITATVDGSGNRTAITIDAA